MKEKTYQIRISCSNCGYVQKKPINIPKGTLWHDHIDKIDLVCEHCGCKVKMNISCIGEMVL